MISTKKLLYKVIGAIDDNNDSISALNTEVAKIGVVVASTPSVSALPVTILNADITADHICVKAVLSNPTAQTAEWTATTSAGSVVVDGTSAINGTTDITLYLATEKN